MPRQLAAGYLTLRQPLSGSWGMWRRTDLKEIVYSGGKYCWFLPKKSTTEYVFCGKNFLENKSYYNKSKQKFNTFFNFRQFFGSFYAIFGDSHVILYAFIKFSLIKYIKKRVFGVKKYHRIHILRYFSKRAKPALPKRQEGGPAMIDIHCHALYGVDDGAKSMGESMAMLGSVLRQYRRSRWQTLWR